jgi:hypothetical protein
MGLPALSEEVQTDHRYDSHRDRGRRSLGSDNLHSSGVGQAKLETIEGGHPGKAGFDGVEGNFQLTARAPQIDQGGRERIGRVVGRH